MCLSVSCNICLIGSFLPENGRYMKKRSIFCNSIFKSLKRKVPVTPINYHCIYRLLSSSPSILQEGLGYFFFLHEFLFISMHSSGAPQVYPVYHAYTLFIHSTWKATEPRPGEILDEVYNLFVVSLCSYFSSSGHCFPPQRAPSRNKNAKTNTHTHTFILPSPVSVQVLEKKD